MEPAKSPLTSATKQPAVLLLGEPGNGKTFSLATVAKHRKLFCLFTEPGGEESLIAGCMHYNIPIDNVHWHYVSPSSTGWDAIQEMGLKVSQMSYKDLGELKSGIDKPAHRQLITLMGVLSSFICQRTNENFGPVDKLGEDCAFAFDSLSGLNDMARELTVGGKPTLHQGEWGVAMQTQVTLVKKIVNDTRCMTIITGHVDKLLDLVAEKMTFQVSLLGNKTAPVFPRMFSDVIWAYRADKKFYWSTTEDKVSGLKGRNIGVVSKVEQDFGKIVEAYEARKNYITTTTNV